MEWMVPVNEMLGDKITKLNYTLIPPGFHGDVRSVRVMQDSLSKLIDTLGEQSSTAQGLNRVITTAEKLRNAPTHILYLLKDSKAKGGKGEVIGLLKVGRKHLFLFDEQDKVCEVEPLCVLDFFIQRDRQRHGYGKMLFDHMLQDMETGPQELAIDGPSPKMEQFLHKNYGMERLLRQNNNFAVSPQFFAAVPQIRITQKERLANKILKHLKYCNLAEPILIRDLRTHDYLNLVDLSKSGRSTPVITPAVGRFAAPKPPSAIANVIHGGGATLHQTTSNGSASGTGTPEHDAPIEAEPEIPETKVEPIGAAEVEPDDADQQKSPERPSTLSVEPMAETPACAASPAGSTMSRRDSQLTDRGYFDVKFYHNKLW